MARVYIHLERIPRPRKLNSSSESVHNLQPNHMLSSILIAVQTDKTRAREQGPMPMNWKFDDINSF